MSIVSLDDVYEDNYGPVLSGLWTGFEYDDFGDAEHSIATVVTKALDMHDMVEFAEKWARQRAGTLSTSLSATADLAIKRTIARSIREGWTQEETATALTKRVGLDPKYAQAVETYRQGLLAKDVPRGVAWEMSRNYADQLRYSRAKKIASYEVVAAYTAAQQELWKQAVDLGEISGRVKRTWVTSKWDRRCKHCVALNGRSVPLSGGVYKAMGRSVVGPPLHPNCFPAGVSVAGSVTGTFKRWYSGELVEITTAAGHVLAGTPNHPVLTDQGWVPLGLLSEGTNVVASDVGQREESTAPHDDEKPVLIEDVAAALRKSLGVSPSCVPMSTEHFHGDGSVGEVDVVRANSRLMGAAREHQSEPLLVGAGNGVGLLNGLSDLASVLDGLALATDGFVGSSREALSLFRTAISSQETIRLGHSADIDAPNSQSFGEVPTTNSVFNSEPVDADSGQVLLLDCPSMALDAITLIRRIPFAGHVYNLESEGGWYIGNGIIVHNCRCHEVLVHPDGGVVKSDFALTKSVVVSKRTACLVCGRKLSSPESMRRGIGPGHLTGSGRLTTNALREAKDKKRNLDLINRQLKANGLSPAELKEKKPAAPRVKNARSAGVGGVGNPLGVSHPTKIINIATGKRYASTTEVGDVFEEIFHVKASKEMTKGFKTRKHGLAVRGLKDRNYPVDYYFGDSGKPGEHFPVEIKSYDGEKNAQVQIKREALSKKIESADETGATTFSFVIQRLTPGKVEGYLLVYNVADLKAKMKKSKGSKPLSFRTTRLAPTYTYEYDASDVEKALAKVKKTRITKGLVYKGNELDADESTEIDDDTIMVISITTSGVSISSPDMAGENDKDEESDDG